MKKKDAQCNSCGWFFHIDELDAVDIKSGEVDYSCPECKTEDLEYL